MPPLTRWFLKAALVYLALALLTGVLLALRVWLSLPAWVSGLGPVYFHLLMVGWVTQLIFGVAHWMFPKASAARPRGDERLTGFVFAALNLGLALRVAGEPWAAAQPGGAAGWLLALSAGLQLAAGWVFVFTLWPRIKIK
ncbi:MAG: hypothetical protein JNK29_06290 [Anaerolineales bacterium]|nr:hypothetical protein [Anaerolineales bacterium]